MIGKSEILNIAALYDYMCNHAIKKITHKDIEISRSDHGGFNILNFMTLDIYDSSIQYTIVIRFIDKDDDISVDLEYVNFKSNTPGLLRDISVSKIDIKVINNFCQDIIDLYLEKDSISLKRAPESFINRILGVEKKNG